MTEHSDTAPTALSPPGPLPDEQLPPYSGDDTVCAKCGFAGASTHYRAAGERDVWKSKSRGPSRGERMERECARCGYVWDEAPTGGGASSRGRCPDRPGCYLKGCLDCALAVPGEPPTADPTTTPDTDAQLDTAYRERAHLVALLAAMTPGAVIAPAVDVDEPGWQIAYLTIGGRQCSWHISPRDVELFAHVEHAALDDPRAQWDGHTTDEKYEHIQRTASQNQEH